jgi:inner membrane protein
MESLPDFLRAPEPYWIWLIAAAVMLFIELAAPGLFFLWLALAAATVGVNLFFFDFSWVTAVLSFAALSVIYVYLGRPWYSAKRASDQPNLNQRYMNYVGHSFVLKEPIVNGMGKLTIEDTRWDIEGPDMVAGARVKILSASGARLKVGPG